MWRAYSAVALTAILSSATALASKPPREEQWAPERLALELLKEQEVDPLAELREALRHDAVTRQQINDRYPGAHLGDLDPAFVFTADELEHAQLKYTTFDAERRMLTGTTPVAVVEAGVAIKPFGKSITIWNPPEELQCLERRLSTLPAPAYTKSLAGAVVYPAAGPAEFAAGYAKLHTLLREAVIDDALAHGGNVIALPRVEGQDSLNVQIGMLGYLPTETVPVLLMRVSYRVYRVPEPPALERICTSHK